MPKKTGDKAIVDTLIDSKARSGRPLRFLKTDGDGIFRSKSFEDIRLDHQFVHEFSAPHDHDSNPEIERDIRTIFEGVATALENAGAPAYFWAEAMHHFIFTKNQLPEVSVTNAETGKAERKSPNLILNPGARPFNLNFLVAFGTMCTCYLPKDRREGGKHPAQRKSFRGAVVGYVLNMSAYKVWDLENRTRREVPFSFTFIHEGFYPFRNKKNCPLVPNRESLFLIARSGRVLGSMILKLRRCLLAVKFCLFLLTRSILLYRQGYPKLFGAMLKSSSQLLLF